MTYEEFKLLAESLMHQDVQYRKKIKEEDDYPMDTFCYYISEIPMGLLHYDRECLSERMYDGEGKVRLFLLRRNLLAIRNHGLPP